MYDITSKTMDGITDLVVVAPIREGFINAYENVTYATRLKLVAEALNRVRVSAREHERVVPFSDVTERILTLLDFRVGIIDKDLFALKRKGRKAGESDAYGETSDRQHDMEPESRRFLYLTATFDGAWEPYMRLIWDPLGPFLDLLFCNCDGYVTATDHSFAHYAQWVRDNQMDSSIFYATTGLTVRDHLYLSKLERLQRSGADALALAEATMTIPETTAEQTRLDHKRKALQLGLEALTVLYKLADYYPPQWMTGAVDGLGEMQEGHRLVRVARDLLLGWDQLTIAFEGELALLPAAHPRRILWAKTKEVYEEPLKWYRTGTADLDARKSARAAAKRPDPDFVRSEVQGGILKVAGSAGAQVQHGALLLFTVRNGKAARAFLKAQRWHFAAGDGADGVDGLFQTVGLTVNGLSRLGVAPCVIDRFPSEFREGMAQRSGQFGDMRENHPRNWILPERNGPVLAGVVPAGTLLPPVALEEVDFVIQLRSTNPDRTALEAVVKALALAAGAGATLESVEWMEGSYDPVTGRFLDHFGFVDGVSQPKPKVTDGDGAPAEGDKDAIALGEILLGYGNDHSDSAPGPFKGEAPWRARFRKFAQKLQFNGTYLVIRKIGEEVDAFDAWLAEQAVQINKDHQLLSAMTPERLKALVLGRNPDGTPLLPTNGGGDNDFDFTNDPKGHGCPFASHVRRANPRVTEFGRKTARLLRRGLRFTQGTPDKPQRGLMFLAYNASIAEQYETIQRWLNGGNSTYVASGHNDPLTGVQPKEELGVFRFVEQGQGGPVAVHVKLPRIQDASPGDEGVEPGRHPFTPLYWGLYLFVPSRSALDLLTTLPEQAAEKNSPYKDMVTKSGEHEVMRDPLEYSVGWATINRLSALSREEAANEWKRLIEDLDAKDPALRDVTPSVWAALRTIKGGAYNLRDAEGAAGTIKSMPPGDLMSPSAELEAAAAAEAVAMPGDPYDWEKGPDRDAQNVIICAGARQVFQVLSDWDHFSSEEQLRRISTNSGPIFVTQQPDNKYFNTKLANAGTNYAFEAHATNEILLAYSEQSGFDAGYAAGTEALLGAKKLAEAVAAGLGRKPFFKMELRRQYLLPALGGLCKRWYGMPDETHMLAKGWGWEAIVAAGTDPKSDTPDGLTRTRAHCPGDFLSPSRNAFYPRPGEQVEAFADSHGKAILAAAKDFVAAHRATNGPPVGSVARAMFAAIPPPHDDVLARNLIGTMVGAIPPMDGNLRGILAEWLGDSSLWRHQSALRRAMGGARADTDFAKARSALYGPVSQAMCKRPAPDLLYRTAKAAATIKVGADERSKSNPDDVNARKGDLVVVSLVSASQRSLMKPEHKGIGDVSIVFGGNRKTAAQGYVVDNGQVCPIADADKRMPVHACPAQDMAMGAIMGIMAALLDAGTLQAQPASLIVRISDW